VARLCVRRFARSPDPRPDPRLDVGRRSIVFAPMQRIRLVPVIAPRHSAERGPAVRSRPVHLGRVQIEHDLDRVADLLADGLVGHLDAALDHTRREAAACSAEFA
jgi:hypothetical protein